MFRCAITAARRTASSSSARLRSSSTSNVSGLSCATFGNCPSIRRVVSHASPAPKITWFSFTPSWICSAPAAIRPSSSSARAGMIASSSGPADVSSVSFTAMRYESVAAIVSREPSKRTRMPVSTGRDSSRDAARETRCTVSSSDDDSISCSGTSTGGSRGKSSAAKMLIRPEYAPDSIDATPSSGLYAIVTSFAGSSRTMSPRSFAGMTTAPSPSTVAGTVDRSESSMSVASSSSSPLLARSRMPPRTWTAPRADAARVTCANRLANASRSTTTRCPSRLRCRFPSFLF